MLRIIYDILICFAASVAALIALSRNLRDPSRRERLADRFGRPLLAIRSPVIWVHAASMGEVQAAAILVRRLLAQYPRHEIVMTTMTTTGAARVKSLFTVDSPERVTHCYLPYDVPFAVRGFLDRAQPRIAVILETELWPNVLKECRRRGVRVVIASARIAPKNSDRYRWMASLFRSALQDVFVAAQTEVDAERFRALGANAVRVTGNLKFDIDISDAVRQNGRSLREGFGNRFVWVAGSTHAGEEAAVISAQRHLLSAHPDSLLIVVPRHPYRFDEVRGLLASSGLSFVTRSSGAPITKDVCVVLVDAMGELLAYYAAADLAFVGGSLVPVGGHNLLEPAALGVATLCGPYVGNAKDVAEQLLRANALLQVNTVDELREKVLQLANDSGRRIEVGQQAHAIVVASRGAAAQTLNVIESMVATAI